MIKKSSPEKDHWNIGIIVILDLVVSIERAGKSRRVRDVMRVSGFNGSAYQTIHSAHIDEDSHAA